MVKKNLSHQIFHEGFYIVAYGCQYTAGSLPAIYDRSVPRLPEHYLVLGDAYCAFNPIYGQGMMVAALSAQMLDRQLRRAAGQYEAGFSRRYFRRLRWLVQLPWMLATSEDARYPLVTGKQRTVLDRVAHRYLDALFTVARQHERVGSTLLQVVHQVRSPLALAHPLIATRALYHLLRSGASDE